MAETNTNSSAPSPSTDITRRQLLTRAAAGGAIVVATACGAGVVVTRAQYELELTKLRALVTLYEQLERVPLDAALATGMNAVRGALELLRAGVRLLRDGVTAAEGALNTFQAALDTLRSAANTASQALNDLQQKYRAAESVVVAVLGVALPLAESIRSFFTSLLSKIPIVGDDLSRAVNALVDLIRAVPTAIDTVTSRLFAPLRDTFFPLSGDAAVKTNLFNPITQNVLEPLKKFLGDVESLFERWEKDFSTPVQAALDQRDKIRAQIVDYRQQNKI